MKLATTGRFSCIAAACALVACNGAALGSDSGEAAQTEKVQPVATAAAKPPPLPQPEPNPLPPAGPSSFVYDGQLTQGGWIRGQVPAGTTSAMLGDQALALDADGNFFAAFDRDAGPSAVLTARTTNGRVIESPVSVSPRTWNIQHINAAKGTGGGSEAWWKKREPEWLAIRDARAQQTGATGWQQNFIWPVKGRISGHFGRQRVYRGEPANYHSGIDIAPGNGVAFVAPADGVVVLARNGFSLEGNIIIIDHGEGLNSAFLHASKIAIREGQSVKQGQYIGNVGATGRVTGPHLHWSLMWRDARVDPLLFTGPMR